MALKQAYLTWAVMLALSFSAAHAQSPQRIVQQVVNTEHAANENDHSRWIYLEEIRKPNQRVLQWVATTRQGDVARILDNNNHQLSEFQQRDLIQQFLNDRRAQYKQVSATNHDNQQIDDLLQLLPVAFLWTQTGATATTSILHFKPAPNFHPPTREAHVFGSMAGDLVIDNQQHRVLAMSGHLLHAVAFGGGILGKLRSGSFSLEQEQVGPGLWQLTAFDLDFEGNALLFKGISLQQDDKRSNFEREPSTITLDKAAVAIMGQPGAVRMQPGVALSASR